MTALIIKDFLVIKKQYLKFFIFAIAFLVFNTNDFTTTFLYITGALLPISAIAYDQQTNWDDYCMALPLSINQIVISKYVLGILATGFMYVFVSALTFLSNLVFTRSLSVFFTLTPLYGMIFSLMVISFYLPFIIKFGVEKARVIVILLGALMGSGIALFAYSNRSFSFVVSGFSLVSMFIIALIFTVCSIFLSIHFYKKRYS